MARSYRKTPIFGNTSAKSEKLDKRLASRRLRAQERQALHSGDDPPDPRGAYNMAWDGAKDGKHYWHKAADKDMRK